MVLVSTALDASEGMGASSGSSVTQEAQAPSGRGSRAERRHGLISLCWLWRTAQKTCLSAYFLYIPRVPRKLAGSRPLLQLSDPTVAERRRLL